MRTLYRLWLPLALLLLAGCKKEPPITCDYIITPYIQTEDKGETTLTGDVVGYAFYADSTAWIVASYADALAGTLTGRQGSAKKQYDFIATPAENGTLTLGPVVSKPIMIVVCHTAMQTYAWKQADVAGGIDRITTSVTFRPWKEEEHYVESSWRMVNAPQPE